MVTLKLFSRLPSNKVCKLNHRSLAKNTRTLQWLWGNAKLWLQLSQSNINQWKLFPNNNKESGESQTYLETEDIKWLQKSEAKNKLCKETLETHLRHMKRWLAVFCSPPSFRIFDFLEESWRHWMLAHTGALATMTTQKPLKKQAWQRRANKNA